MKRTVSEYADHKSHLGFYSRELSSVIYCVCERERERARERERDKEVTHEAYIYKRGES